jgi:hypothetical protein
VFAAVSHLVKSLGAIKPITKTVLKGIALVIDYRSVKDKPNIKNKNPDECFFE